MKFNRLCFLPIIFMCTISVFSQSVFAEDSTPSDTPSPCDLNQSYNNGACALQNIRYVDDEGLVQNCPGSASNGASTNHYEFIKDENIHSVGIDSCVIQLDLKKSVCGEGTNVVYVFDKDTYDSTKNENPVMQYVLRREDFRVVAGTNSRLTGENETSSYPSAVIATNSGYHLLDAAERNKDYCTLCPGATAEGLLGWVSEDKTSLYSFTKVSSIITQDIESCAVKLKIGSGYSSCGTGTNVVYLYDAQQDAYVRKESFKVFAGTRSFIAKDDQGNDEYPGDILTRDNHEAEKDYCATCPGNLYTIEGKCVYCHTGHYLRTDTDARGNTHYSCEICPAGYACPGNTGEKAGDLSVPLESSDASGSLMGKDIIACGRDEYAQTGQTQCSKCSMGYSTYTSGPARAIEEEDGKIFDGKCQERANGFGILCTSVEACKSIPTQLCFRSDCQCTKTNYSATGNYIEERQSCGSSYDFGDDKVWGVINTKVVKTLQKNTN